MKLKPFQYSTVEILVRQARGLLDSSGDNKTLVFKAPTGSGKTIMMAEFFKQISEEDSFKNYVYIWASLYDLHIQSNKKIKNYLGDTFYSFLDLEQLTQDALLQGTILFANWHSLTTTKLNSESGIFEWSNRFVREREDGRSIREVLEKTRTQNLEIILVVDEAHRNYLTENSQKFIMDILKPKLTIEVSATPLLPEPSYTRVTNKEAGWVEVPFVEVVKSGLIKSATAINADIGDFVDISNSVDESVIEAALSKRIELKNIYSKENSEVNPLLLIQLPSESTATSALDQTIREVVERQLAKHGITYENGKLAVWLANTNDKKNLDQIEHNDSDVDVLIFKEAVAVGWDCPRAQVLVMLREMKSLTFKIQTVGRILRMPEAKHYESEELNMAYVYTNLPEIVIDNNSDELGFFKIRFSYIKGNLGNLKLPSAYVHRQDYGDLTSSFSRLLVMELNQRFSIDSAESITSAYEKVDLELELEPEELKIPVLSNLIIQNLDILKEEIGTFDIEKISADASEVNIEKQFEYLTKAWSLPYAPVRSFSKIKTGIYEWFNQIGFEYDSWDEVQRIIACSIKNQELFGKVISVAKEKYEEIRNKEIQDKKSQSEFIFSIPETDQFGEMYELVQAKKYVHEPCLLRKDRSLPERTFENLLEISDSVIWWYKNGEGSQKYFGIPYTFEDQETGKNRLANFYPDYVVEFSDKTIGIYDTKAGNTITDLSTFHKSNQLQKYIKEQNSKGKKLVGGIVNVRDNGVFLFTGPEYSPLISEWDNFNP